MPAGDTNLPPSEAARLFYQGQGSLDVLIAVTVAATAHCWRRAFRILRCRASAEDVYQEAIKNFIVQLHDGAVIEKPVEYVSRSVYYGAVTYRRAGDRWQELPVELPATNPPSQERLLFYRELRDALRKLRPKDRRLVFEHLVRGVSPGELAAKTGRKLAAVRSACNRARIRLQRILRPGAANERKAKRQAKAKPMLIRRKTGRKDAAS